MSQPPPNFDPTSTLLPRVDAPITVQTGGGYYDIKSNDDAVSFLPTKTHLQDGGAFTSEENIILEKYSIGQKLQAEIGESTLREFIVQVQSPKCSAGAGAGILLHKDCWAVQAVITHLLRKSLPDTVRKSNINVSIKYETIPTSEDTSIDFKGIGDGFSSMFQSNTDGIIKKPEFIKKKQYKQVTKDTTQIHVEAPVSSKEVPVEVPVEVPIEVPVENSETLLKRLEKEKREREEIERKSEFESTLETRIQEFIANHRENIYVLFEEAGILSLQGKKNVPEGETNYGYSVYIDRLFTILELILQYDTQLQDLNTQIERDEKFKINENQKINVDRKLEGIQDSFSEIVTYMRDTIINSQYSTHDTETQKIADLDVKLKNYAKLYKILDETYQLPVTISPQVAYSYILENIKLLPGTEGDNTTLRGRFTTELEGLYNQYQTQPSDEYEVFGKKVYDARMYLTELSTNLVKIEESIRKFEELEQKFVDVQAKSKKANIRSSELNQVRDILQTMRPIQIILTIEHPSDEEIYAVNTYNFDTIKDTYEILQKRSELSTSEKLRNRFTRKRKNNNTTTATNTTPNNGKGTEIRNRGRNIDGAETSIIAIMAKINTNMYNFKYKYPHFLKGVIDTYYSRIQSYQTKLVKRNVNTFTRQNITEIADMSNILSDLFFQLDIFNRNLFEITNNRDAFLQKVSPSAYETQTRQSKYNETTEIVNNITKMTPIDPLDTEVIEQIKQRVITASDALHTISVFLEGDGAETPPAPKRSNIPSSSARFTPTQLSAFDILGIPQSSRGNIKKYASIYRKKIAPYHPDRHASSSNAEKEQARIRYQEIQDAYDILTGQSGGVKKKTRRNRKTKSKKSRKYTR